MSTKQRVLGMDISYAQGFSVNFQKAAEMGVKFCFIRASSGRSNIDPNYDHNYMHAGSAGMFRGIYYYLYPEQSANVGTIEDQTPEGQARRFAAMLKPGAELGEVLDVEAKNLSPNEVKRFVDEFQKHDPYGRPITIYTGPGYWSAWRGYTGSAVAWAANHPLWTAEYTGQTEPVYLPDTFIVATPDPWNRYTFHQWTDVGGSLAGHVTKNLDLNYFHGSLADLKAWAGAAAPVKSTKKAPANLKYVIAKLGLNLRNKPSTQGAIVKTMAWAESVEVIEDGEWASLKSGNDTGYASSTYLSSENPLHNSQAQG